MGLIGLLELSGITLHGLPVVSVACDFVLDVTDAPYECAADESVVILAMGDVFVLDAHIIVYELDAGEQDFILGCPP